MNIPIIVKLILVLIFLCSSIIVTYGSLTGFIGYPLWFALVTSTASITICIIGTLLVLLPTKRKGPQYEIPS